MALAKSIVPLPIDRGLDTKIDIKQEEPGFLRTAENVVYETIKLLKKRNGYDNVPLLDINDAMIEDALSLSKFNNELIVLTKNKLYAQSQAYDRFVQKGSLYSTTNTSNSIIRNSRNQSQASSMVVENFEVYAWTDSSGGVRYSVQDSLNKTFIVSDALVVASGNRPKVGRIQNNVYIFYADGANIRYKKFSILAPSSLSSAVTVQTDLDTTAPLYDIESVQSKMFVAYNSNVAGSQLRLFNINSAESVSSVVSFATQIADSAINLTSDAQSRIILSWSDGTAVKYLIYSFSFAASILGVTTIETINNVVNVTVEQNGGDYLFFYEISDTNAKNHYVKKAEGDLQGNVSNISVLIRSVGLSSRAFKYDDTIFLCVVHESALQSTYFLIDSNGVVLNKMNSQNAEGLIDYGTLRKVYVSGSTALITNQVKGRLVSENGTFDTVNGVNTNTISFDPENKFQDAFSQDNLHICAGILKMYDGASVVEHGFHLYPEDLEQISPVEITTEITVQGQAENKETQVIKFSNVPNAGAFTIDIEGQVTNSIPYTAVAADIKTELEALSNITTVTVIGSFATQQFVIRFDDPVFGLDLLTIPTNTLNNSGSATTPTIYFDTVGNAEVKEHQTITFDEVPIEGSFKMVVGAETTTAINYSMTASEVKFALESLTAITTVTVTGNFSSGFNITFDNPVTGIPQIEITENTLSAVASVVGEMSDGNYGYVAVYRWTDNNGREHLSAPTPQALQVILNGGTDTQSVQVRVPTLRVTEKENVIIDVYRTEANGTIYYKITSSTNPTLNSKTVDYIDFTDTISDAELITRELLYTTGGVLENIAAPSCNLITIFNNRLAVVGEERNRLIFSKLTEEGKPVEFTDLIYKDVDDYGGPISTILTMDDKLLIFEKDATLYMTGDGPNNLLQQDSFTNPELIASDIGSLNPDSAVLTPNGIMFKSRKGIWQVSRGLSLEYVGARVEQFNDSTITSADIVGELNQIRFTTSEELALVYNYNLDKWATFTNHGAKSAVVLGNDYYYLREDGLLYKENRNTFSDASSPIKFRMETGWLSFNQLQGFQRVYCALILGTYKSAHKLRVKVAYNFVDAYVQEQIIDVTDFVDTTAYGDYSPYGDPSTVNYGGNLDGSLYQLRIDMERQKCQSIKILIEDAQDQVGEGLTLSAITLKVGAKQGEFKMGASNKFGVS